MKPLYIFFLLLLILIYSCNTPFPKQGLPIVVSTWPGGVRCNAVTLAELNSKTDLLTAIEKGIHVLENDSTELSVGFGGLPDKDGEVTLDASIMDWNGNAGAVCYLKGIKNPISVARLVMEKTPHVMLAGEGAQKFAIENGFEVQNLLTEIAKKDWLKNKNQVKNFSNHDTIGLLALDEDGKIAGGVSTSGWAYKVPGRVGDSPIIGAGLYVDGKVGGAVATGKGELAMRTLGCFLVVEKMAEGYSPKEACKMVCERINKNYPGDGEEFQIAFVALSVNGDHGAYSITDGFLYSSTTNESEEIIDSEFIYKRNQ